MSASVHVDRIRNVLEKFGRLPITIAEVAADDDLYDKGLTSHASVNVMIGLEDEFDVEFPDALLQKSTFASIESIAAAVDSLLAG
ncbi:acyl carrier protein [Rhodococcus daqingensis]|uniref:Acyl carrier protein n=1 Tax=Rhodococcus daqingensis TaxID=2479363 RepID=A0ABW2RRQ2_9NOCA